MLRQNCGGSKNYRKISCISGYAEYGVEGDGLVSICEAEVHGEGVAVRLDRILYHLSWEL